MFSGLFWILHIMEVIHDLHIMKTQVSSKSFEYGNNSKIFLFRENKMECICVGLDFLDKLLHLIVLWCKIKDFIVFTVLIKESESIESIDDYAKYDFCHNLYRGLIEWIEWTWLTNQAQLIILEYMNIILFADGLHYTYLWQ